MAGTKLYPLAALGVLIVSATLSCETPSEPPLEPSEPSELFGIGIGIGDDDGGDGGDDDDSSTDPADATPLPCPTTETHTATRVIGVLGGTVRAGGSSITLPFGAVLVPTRITLTVPPSEYMEIDIEANGREHFNFAVPARIVIGYGRCTDPAFDEGPLVAWYWDSVLDVLLEPFPTVDDKTARTVTFRSGHLSGFLIAN